LHITSMAGTWLSIVEGFGGMRIKDNTISLDPIIPGHWKSFSFNVLFRSHTLKINVTEKGIYVTNHCNEPLDILLKSNLISLGAEETKFIPS